MLPLVPVFGAAIAAWAAGEHFGILPAHDGGRGPSAGSGQHVAGHRTGTDRYGALSRHESFGAVAADVEEEVEDLEAELGVY